MASGILGALNELQPTRWIMPRPERIPRLRGLSAVGLFRESIETLEVAGSIQAQAALARFTTLESVVLGIRQPLEYQSYAASYVATAGVFRPSSVLNIRVADEIRVIDVVPIQLANEVVQLERFDPAAIIDLPIGDVLWHAEATTAWQPFAGRLETPNAARKTPYISLIRNLIENDRISQARALLNALPEETVDQPQLMELRRVLALPKVSTTKMTDMDRAREYEWLKSHERDYRGQWVAVDGDRLVLSAGSLKELIDELKRLNLARRPLIHRL